MRLSVFCQMSVALSNNDSSEALSMKLNGNRKLSGESEKIEKIFYLSEYVLWMKKMKVFNYRQTLTAMMKI